MRWQETNALFLRRETHFQLVRRFLGGGGGWNKTPWRGRIGQVESGPPGGCRLGEFWLMCVPQLHPASSPSWRPATGLGLKHPAHLPQGLHTCSLPWKSLARIATWLAPLFRSNLCFSVSETHPKHYLKWQHPPYTPELPHPTSVPFLHSNYHFI